MIESLALAPNTNAIGNLSEAKVLAALSELGFTLSLPFGAGCGYDFVLDDGSSRLLRVQVKTGRLRGGCVHFAAWSHNGSRGSQRKRRYSARADVFAVYCPDNEKVYMIPVSDVALEGRLRIEAPKNNQSKHVRWAAPYELIK